MIGRSSPPLYGIPSDKIAKRASELLAEGWFPYSAAWYEAYDELLAISGRAPLREAASAAMATAASVPIAVVAAPKIQVATLGGPTVDELLEIGAAKTS